MLASLLLPLAPFHAGATTVKHVAQWTLAFPKGSAALTPLHRHDLVRVAESLDRHCLPAPAGGALLVIEAVEAQGGLSAQGRRTALDRIHNVRSMLERLAPPATTLIEDLMTRRQWQARAAAASVPMRRPSGDEVLLELACDPRP